MIPRISPMDVRDRIAAGEPVVFLDIREESERDYCRIGDGPFIPLGELHQRAEELEVPEDALLVVYCHHGIRSLTGVAILQQKGFENLASLNGGIDAWSVQVDPRVPRY